MFLILIIKKIEEGEATTMRKTSILAGTLAAALLLTGCQESKVEEKVEAETKAEVKKENTEKEKVEAKETVEEIKAPSMEKEAVTKLINTTLESVKTALDTAWEENNWNSSTEADLNVFKEKLRNVTSEEFVDTQIQDMMDNKYYEGTDIRYLPFGIRTEIKLDIKQDENTLEAVSFIPEDYINSGALYTFTFNYIDNKWILKDLTGEPLINLGLTIEESQQLIENYLGYSEVSFKEDKQTDKGTVFVFSLGNDATLTYNPNTTEFIEEYPEVKKEEEPQEDISSENVDYAELDAKAEEIVKGFKREEPSPGTIKSQAYYGKLLYAIQDYMRNVDGYDEQEYGKWAGQYPFSKAEYLLADQVLNEVWGILKKDLEPSQFETLKEEQIKWLEEAEADARKSEESADNELMGRDYYYGFLFADVITRCEELINTYLIYEGL